MKTKGSCRWGGAKRLNVNKLFTWGYATFCWGRWRAHPRIISWKMFRYEANGAKLELHPTARERSNFSLILAIFLPSVRHISCHLCAEIGHPRENLFGTERDIFQPHLLFAAVATAATDCNHQPQNCKKTKTKKFGCLWCRQKPHVLFVFRHGFIHQLSS